MKQKFFLVALSGLALAACTQVEDVPEVRNNAIGFTNVVNKNSRAVTGDLSLNNFDLFSVYGYFVAPDKENHPVQVFAGDIVSKVTDTEGEEGATKWTYSPERYWNPGASYYFYAYSCADVALDNTYGSLLLDLTQTTTADRALEINNYKCDATHQHDLIVAKNEGLVGQEKGNGVIVNRTVNFTFEHALSKINAEFTNAFPQGYDIVVSNVKLVNFYDQAGFDFAPLDWKDFTQTAPNKSVELAIAKGTDTAIKDPDPDKCVSVVTGSAFMIPMNYVNGDPNNKDAHAELHFTVQVKQGNDIFLERNLKGTWQPNWKKGTAYTYHIDIAGTTALLEPIVFASTQNMSDNSWGTPERVEMVFSMQ